MTVNIKKSQFNNLIKAAFNDLLFEAHNKKHIKITINGKEMPYGSPEHIDDMQKTLEGLQRTRDCYEKGSSGRLIFSQACTKLKKVLDSLQPKPTSISQKNITL